MSKPDFRGQDSEAHEIERATTRIRQVQLAKTLAQRSRFGEALKILHKVREQYEEEANKRMVDWLISEVERQQGSARFEGES